MKGLHSAATPPSPGRLLQGWVTNSRQLLPRVASLEAGEEACSLPGSPAPSLLLSLLLPAAPENHWSSSQVCTDLVQSLTHPPARPFYHESLLVLYVCYTFIYFFKRHGERYLYLLPHSTITPTTEWRNRAHGQAKAKEPGTASASPTWVSGAPGLDPSPAPQPHPGVCISWKSGWEHEPRFEPKCSDGM